MLAPFLEKDVAPFLALAKDEGWISDRWELEFLLQGFPQGCFVWLGKTGTLGYITSIRYGRSGWIGNLLVRPEARRHGIGRGLIECTITELLKADVETVWLTASAKGAALYRQIGFFPIDSINRWVGKGVGNRAVKSVPFEVESVREVDRAGWGERRDLLLRAICGRGRLYSSSGGFLCCQRWDEGMQIGPWGCLIASQAGQLLDQALAGAGEGEGIFLDVPAGNLAVPPLLIKRGFTVKGSNLLMYLGAEPQYQPKNVFALASMGSMG